MARAEWLARLFRSFVWMCAPNLWHHGSTRSERQLARNQTCIGFLFSARELRILLLIALNGNLRVCMFRAKESYDSSDREKAVGGLFPLKILRPTRKLRKIHQMHHPSLHRDRWGKDRLKRRPLNHGLEWRASSRFRSESGILRRLEALGCCEDFGCCRWFDQASLFPARNADGVESFRRACASLRVPSSCLSLPFSGLARGVKECR